MVKNDDRKKKKNIIQVIMFNVYILLLLVGPKRTI